MPKTVDNPYSLFYLGKNGQINYELVGRTLTFSIDNIRCADESCNFMSGDSKYWQISLISYRIVLSPNEYEVDYNINCDFYNSSVIDSGQYITSKFLEHLKSDNKLYFNFTIDNLTSNFLKKDNDYILLDDIYVNVGVNVMLSDGLGNIV